ncbi:unnamed protein product [Caenorhabditis brenneri]
MPVLNRSLQCVDCPGSILYGNVEDLEAHIASHHLNICPYECEKCKFAKFPTEYALITHCLDDHGISDFSIKYRFTKELSAKKKILAQKLQRCIAMSSPIPAEVKVNDTVSSTVENRVKTESGEQPSAPGQSVSPGAFGENVQHPSYRAFLDEALARHEEERAGPSFDDMHDGSLGPIKCKIQVQCCLCSEKVSKQRSSMVYHANTRHGKYELYECGYCHRKWQTIAKSDVIKHIKSHHELADGSIDYTMLIDYRKHLGSKLKEVTDRCFPEKKKKRIGYTDAY